MHVTHSHDFYFFCPAFRGGGNGFFFRKSLRATYSPNNLICAKIVEKKVNYAFFFNLAFFYKILRKLPVFVLEKFYTSLTHSFSVCEKEALGEKKYNFSHSRYFWPKVGNFKLPPGKNRIPLNHVIKIIFELPPPSPRHPKLIHVASPPMKWHLCSKKAKIMCLNGCSPIFYVEIFFVKNPYFGTLNQ